MRAWRGHRGVRLGVGALVGVKDREEAGVNSSQGQSLGKHVGILAGGSSRSPSAALLQVCPSKTCIALVQPGEPLWPKCQLSFLDRAPLVAKSSGSKASCRPVEDSVNNTKLLELTLF